VDRWKATTSNTRDQWLDILRGVAILGVVVVHVMQSSDAFTTSHGGKTNALFTRIASNGAWGVELFFFLSGWLLCSIYMTTSDKLKKNYWHRRMARIIPLWVIFLIIEIARHYFFRNGPIHVLLVSKEIPHNSFFSQTSVIIISTLTFTLWFSGVLWNSVILGGWSIQAEVGHYLVFPMIRNRSANTIFLALSSVNIATLLINYIVQHNYLKAPLFLLIFNAWIRLDLYATFGYFIFGIFSYQFNQNYKKFKNIGQSLKSLRINLFCLLIYVVTWLVLPIAYGHHGQIQTLAFVLLFIVLSKFIAKVFFLRHVFIILGRFSYFIYFFHFLVIELVSTLSRNFSGDLNFLGSFFVAFIAYLIPVLTISCLFAIPSEMLIEKPIMRIARKA
jgi:peptidoglycan/LPS O-acetylase OafA/YrhL